MYVGVPTDPPLGTPAADRPTHLTPPPTSRPPKVFTPGWGLEFEQAAALGHVAWRGVGWCPVVCCDVALLLFASQQCGVRAAETKHQWRGGKNVKKETELTIVRAALYQKAG